MNINILSSLKRIFYSALFSPRPWPRADRLRHPFRAALFSLVVLIPTLWALSSVVEHYLDLSILSPTENNDRNYDPFDLIQRAQTAADGPIDERIVIVDIGRIDRRGIAAATEVILGHSPAVVGIDIDLEQPSSGVDTSGTASLLGLLSRDKRVIMGYDLGTMRHVDTWRRQMSGQWGYVSLNVPDSLATVRTFAPAINGSGDARYPDYHYSLAAQMVKRYSMDKWLAYWQGSSDLDSQMELVRFVRTDDPAGAFAVCEFADLVDYDTSNANAQLKGKIVIVADRSTCPESDLHYTPLNPVLSGHSSPDMQGSELHARWVSNILDGRRLRPLSTCSKWFSIFLIELILCTLLAYMDSGNKWWKVANIVLRPVLFLVMTFLIYLVSSWMLTKGIALPILAFVVPVWLTSGFVEAYNIFRS